MRGLARWLLLGYQGKGGYGGGKKAWGGPNSDTSHGTSVSSWFNKTGAGEAVPIQAAQATSRR